MQVAIADDVVTIALIVSTEQIFQVLRTTAANVVSEGSAIKQIHLSVS